jgi:hypothetical protein
MVVGAIDQQSANATGAHFSKGDLLAGGDRHVGVRASSYICSPLSCREPIPLQVWQTPVSY